MRSTLFSLITSIFKKGNHDIWKRFASKNNGTYSFTYNSKVSVPYKGFELRFDAYTHYVTAGSSCYESDFTRVSVELKSFDNLKFRVFSQDFVETIAIWFGAQDIVVGNPAFDKRFRVKGNDAFKIQDLFAAGKAQELLMKPKHIYLALDDEGNFDEKVPEDCMLLYAFSQDKLTSLQQLDDLLVVFQELLDRLLKFNSVRTVE